jgi:hypothetical protein
VADTGVAIGSDRLHRRRPFRSGTRMYLHNEAFHVAADEDVRVSLEPITHGGLSSGVALATMGVLGLVGMLAVLAPLRTSDAGIESAVIGEDEAVVERERIYASIRDLDHDFETRKIGDREYELTRNALKAEAVESLRRQRDERATREILSPAPAPALAGTPTASPATGAFCTECGHQIETGWRFCSSCGTPIARARGDG